MSDASYTIEFAKSGRAKCKKCKELLVKGELRLGAHTTGGPFDVTNWTHPACFSLPRKLSSGANKISPEDFVNDLLEDSSGGEILPEKADEIAAAIAAVAPKKKGEGEVKSVITDLRDAFAERKRVQEEGEGAKQPDAKKHKKVDPILLEAFGHYHDKKGGDLGDILQWNRQFKSGKKDYQLEKVIDGHVHGRLGRCALCTGRLKLNEGGATVKCNGSFDEDKQIRVDCAFVAPVAEAPRWKPWYTEEPSEEENDEMDRLNEEATGNEDPNKQSSDPDVVALIEAAGKLEWKIGNRKEVKASTTGMVELMLNHKGKTVDIPQELQEAIKKVGPLIIANREKPPEEVVPLIIKEFGFVETKKAKAEKKEAAIESMVTCSKNSGLVAAFQELSELYFKEGNRNAGSSYTKATNAVKSLSFEVTEENAKKLGRAGKSKVEGVGAKMAEKMLEFLQTGTMEKLEEKRADAK